MTKMQNINEFAKPSTDWSVNDLPEAAQIELRKEIEQATTEAKPLSSDDFAAWLANLK